MPSKKDYESSQSSTSTNKINTPCLDVIKTRIQASPGEYKNMIDCARRCYQSEGIRIMFRGLVPTLLRAFPSNAATFVAYTWTMKMLTEDTRSLGQNNAAAII